MGCQRFRGGEGVLAGLESRRPGQVELALPGCQLLPRRGRERFRLAAACAEPRCSMLREPRWDAYTICTATAPEAVFTVRTHVTDETTSPVSAQIHRSLPVNLQATALCPSEPDPVTKVRLNPNRQAAMLDRLAGW